MIKIEYLKESDIGRMVRYTPFPNCPVDQLEYGIITSFNKRNIFVRYNKQHPSHNGQATTPLDLEFV